MKTHNKALDYVVLAMAQGRKGNMTTAAKLFAEAIKQPDAVRAIATLETSNRMAFEATAKRIQASKKVKAGEEFDMDEEAMAGLMDDDMGEDLGSEQIEADYEDEDAEDDESAAFAKVLASMTRRKR